MNLQLAYHLGFTEVILIGMDFSYAIPDSAVVKGKDITSTDDDPNHFHPNYFGKGKRWHDPELDRVLPHKLAGRCSRRRGAGSSTQPTAASSKSTIGSITSRCSRRPHGNLHTDVRLSRRFG